MNRYLKWLVDAAERVVKTFVQGFVATWILTQDKSWDGFWDLENAKAGLVAGALALAMAIMGRQIGSPATASWLPKGPDTEAG